MELFRTYAKYNQWMNNSLYEKCIDLGQQNIEKDQGAFFESILKTLNHLLIADIFWLSRCTGDKSVAKLEDSDGNRILLTSLDQIVYRDISQLFKARQKIDADIVQYVSSLSSTDAGREITYSTSQGVTQSKAVESVLLHWFNHQTHHRGQVTVMLSQQGIDYGLTDLIYVKDLD